MSIYRGFNMRQDKDGKWQWNIEADKWKVGYLHMLTGEHTDFATEEECMDDIDKHRKSLRA